MIKKLLLSLAVALAIALALAWLSQSLMEAIDYEITSRSRDSHGESYVLQDDDYAAFKLRP